MSNETADKLMPMNEHLKELRKRLLFSFAFVIIFFALAFLFKKEVFSFLTLPLEKAQNNGAVMIFTGVPEMFFTYLKISFLVALFVGIPVFLWQIWRFIAPALYLQEKKVIAPFLFATPLLFYLGGAFTYFFVMPLAINFFISFETETVKSLPAVKEYITFFTKMAFAFGLAFELPVFLLLLVKFGVLTVEKLKYFRRYAFVIAFIIAAILTPPDPFSQLLLAIPLIVFYEIAIFGANLINKKGEKVNG